MSTKEILDELATQNKKLKKQIRIIYIFVGMLFVTMLTAAASLVSNFESINVKSINVVDDIGKVRISINGDDGGEALIKFFNKDGIERISQGILKDGNARYRIFYENGNPAISATSFSEASKRYQDKIQAGITLYHPNNRPSVNLSTEMGASRLEMLPSAKHLGRISQYLDDEMAISAVFSHLGTERLRMISTENGISFFESKKDNGERNFIIGTDGDGKSVNYSSDFSISDIADIAEIISLGLKLLE